MIEINSSIPIVYQSGILSKYKKFIEENPDLLTKDHLVMVSFVDGIISYRELFSGKDYEFNTLLIEPNLYSSIDDYFNKLEVQLNKSIDIAMDGNIFYGFFNHFITYEFFEDIVFQNLLFKMERDPLRDRSINKIFSYYIFKVLPKLSKDSKISFYKKLFRDNSPIMVFKHHNFNLMFDPLYIDVLFTLNYNEVDGLNINKQLMFYDLSKPLIQRLKHLREELIDNYGTNAEEFYLEFDLKIDTNSND